MHPPTIPDIHLAIKTKYWNLPTRKKKLILKVFGRWYDRDKDHKQNKRFRSQVSTYWECHFISASVKVDQQLNNKYENIEVRWNKRTRDCIRKANTNHEASTHIIYKCRQIETSQIQYSSWAYSNQYQLQFQATHKKKIETNLIKTTNKITKMVLDF